MKIAKIDEMRFILRKHRLGRTLSDANANKYMMIHRYLTRKEMARRMRDICVFLKIMDKDNENNSVKHWCDAIDRMVQWTKVGFGFAQCGIFTIEKEERQFGGLAYIIRADIGFVLDNRYVGDEK